MAARSSDARASAACFAVAPFQTTFLVFSSIGISPLAGQDREFAWGQIFSFGQKKKRPHRNSIPCAGVFFSYAWIQPLRDRQNPLPAHRGRSGTIPSFCSCCFAIEIFTEPMRTGDRTLGCEGLPSISGPVGTKVNCGFSSLDLMATARALFAGKLKCSGLNSP